MRARIAAFNKDFMSQFDAQHREAFPHLQKAPDMGYPDCGCGYYGKKLSYDMWLKMNNGQRVQINFLEQITFTLVTGFIGGLFMPEWTTYTLSAWFVGRFLFTLGYTSKGPQGRLAGALIMDLCMLGLLVFMVMSLNKYAAWW